MDSTNFFSQSHRISSFLHAHCSFGFCPLISNPKLVAPKPQQLLCISHSPHAGHSWKPYEHASGTTEPEREATAVEYTHCQLYPAKALSTYEFHGKGCYLHFSSSAQIFSHESNEKLVDLTNITKSLT